MDLSKINQKIQQIKIKHKDYELSEEAIKYDPFEQFIDWFSEALQTIEQYDPNVMVLATVDENNYPDTRIVLLKALELNRFIFFSSYNSKKATELLKNNVVALNFYWPDYERQVRMRGRVEKLARHKSEAYFSSRPREAQLSTYAWMQSEIVDSRKEMDKRMELVKKKFSSQSIPCPDHWGGYVVIPFEYEFFQGRRWRIHDRLFYTLQNKKWNMVRLAP